MGRKKDKLVKRVVTFYKSVFKFDAPLKILLDGNFIAVSMRKRLELKNQLTKVLDENVHIVITSCIINEIREINKTIPGILDYAMRYKIEECSHNYSPEDCIKSHIGHKNQKKYYVATQDPNLRKELRQIPGVPIILLDQNIVIIEKPSFASKEAFARRESLKMEPTKDEKKIISKEKKEINDYMKNEYMRSAHYKKRIEDIRLMRINGRLRKKANGPNPLSILKKKKKPNEKDIVNITEKNIEVNDNSQDKPQVDENLTQYIGQDSVKRKRNNLKLCGLLESKRALELL